MSMISNLIEPPPPPGGGGFFFGGLPQKNPGGKDPPQTKNQNFAE